MWRMRQEMPEKGHISGPSQIYFFLREKKARDFSTIQVAPKPIKQRVGQRAPERDPVGEASNPAARQAIGCPFTEAISVTPAQIEEARVSLFECPTCLATRDITPKGNRVKFPWHPRRKTATPNQGLRWVKRGITWRLSDEGSVTPT